MFGSDYSGIDADAKLSDIFGWGFIDVCGYWYDC